MKKLIFLIQLLIIAQFNNHLWGQEKKNTVQISGISAHYINNEKNKLYGSNEGYYEFPVAPGVELLYLRTLSPKTKIGTGFNFQKGRVASYISGLRRFRFNEINLPLILQTRYNLSAKNKIFISPGVYMGVVSNIIAESPDKNENWHAYIDFDALEKPSDDTFFIDLYFDAGYSRLLTNRSEISIAPFVKYRVNTTWLNTHQKKTHVGIKINYSFNF